MSQVAGETVDQFVCRLRQKAITCDFPNVDEAIRDQLVILLRIVTVLLEIRNARNVELLDILLRAAENGTIKTQKNDIRKGMKAERRELIK